MDTSRQLTDQPLRRTVLRTGLIALAVGVAVGLSRGNAALIMPWAAMALWVSLGGHYVEVLFLRGVRPRLPDARAARLAARVVTWAAFGPVLFVAAAVTARLLGVMPPAWHLSWVGAPGFVAVEIIAHSALAARRLPNAFADTG